MLIYTNNIWFPLDRDMCLVRSDLTFARRTYYDYVHRGLRNMVQLDCHPTSSVPDVVEVLYARTSSVLTSQPRETPIWLPSRVANIIDNRCPLRVPNVITPHIIIRHEVPRRIKIAHRIHSRVPLGRRASGRAATYCRCAL